MVVKHWLLKYLVLFNNICSENILLLIKILLDFLERLSDAKDGAEGQIAGLVCSDIVRMMFFHYWTKKLKVMRMR